MYTNTALYYLNQLGITPWIAKDRDLPSEDHEEMASRLVVFIPTNQSLKAQALLKRLLGFVGLAEDDVEIIYKANLQASDYNTLNRPSLLAVLLLGFKPAPVDLTCPLFVCDDLEFLLLNPSNKKNVFQELLRLKNQLASYLIGA